jgi:hypothetical protein
MTKRAITPAPAVQLSDAAAQSDTAQPKRRLVPMPLDDIQGDPRNAKGHAEAAIRRSIEHHGLAELPLLDERTGYLAAGHGRLDQLRAMQATGATPPEGIEQDAEGRWLVPVIRGWSSRSDEDAAAYLIGSNRLSELGGWDDHGLAELLSELADAQLLELAGYTPDDLSDLVAALDTSEPDLSDFPEYDETAASKVKKVTCPNCDHEFTP